ncbi:RND efflux system [Vibrio ishigakensis]|uniref:RND efflux system n=1 Tax=Vibrio ishigakensis TaxID=1481914 RepID=A0A0B8QJW3_9VIBR|nr:RND efflux system [Vibrio ishigakensis]
MKIRPLYLVTALALVGCGNSEETNVSPQGMTSTPVSVFEAQAFEHSPTYYFVGRMQAIESAKLTPRTTGHLLKKYFEDGATVEKGAVLFEIDPTSYQAALDAAIAAYEEANAAFELAKLNHQRNQNMLNTGGLSQAQLDLSTAELSMAHSRVSSARANVVVQRDNLEQTKVRAPYDGQLGKSNFSIGDMVGPSFGPLIDLVQTHPIEASFSIKESDLARHNLASDDGDQVSLKLEGEQTAAFGEISFVDNKINPASGTIAVAARFENEDLVYRPNQYIRVGLSPSELYQGVKIPHAAVHQDANAQFVLIVEDGVVARADVEIADRIGQNVFVTAGLEPSVPVIIGGLQRVGEGAQVVISE